jgi:alkylation response protein AidB-like acyl-CoA dehydrogenase
MDTRYSAEQRELRLELRNYFRKIMTPDVVAEVVGKEGGPRFREIIEKLGEDGILTLGWPKEYGGKEYTTLEQLILFEEAWSAHTPFPLITINTVGPAIMQFGTDEQKAFFLPKIAAGQCIFSVGYTEAGSGTDLASLKLPAEPDGDGYVVNGNKLFTSSGQDCDYVWLAARTDKGVKRPSDGITIFIVDAKDPGYSFAPIRTVGDIETSMTYYDNIHVPANRILGGLNGGWRVITSQLNHERVTLASMTVIGAKQFRRIVSLLDEKSKEGNGPLNDPLVRAKIGEAYARLEAIEVLNLRTAKQIEDDNLDVALASGVKFQNTLELIEVLRSLLDLVGEDALVRYPSEGAIFHGDLERDYRSGQVNTVGGGVMEVMRCMVASFGLKMPNTIA